MSLIRTTHYALSGTPAPIERPLTDASPLVLVRKREMANTDPGEIPELGTDERIDRLTDRVETFSESIERIERMVHAILADTAALKAHFDENAEGTL